jgi:prohibitin 2
MSETTPRKGGAKMALRLDRRRTTAFLSGLILLLLILGLWNRIFVTIPPGSVGVLWLRFFGGTVTGFHLGEGTKVILPWDKVYLYNSRLQRVDVSISAMSAEGLPVQIQGSASIQIIPDRVAVLNADVGPDYRTIMLEPAIQAAVRERVAVLSVQELVTMSRLAVETSLLSAIKAKWSVLRNQLTDSTDHLIRIYEFNIREIALPQPFTTAVEDKLAEEQSTQGYKYILAREKLESERRVIEAEGIRKFQEIVTPTITEGLLRWRGIEATLALAKSNNAKVVVVGGGASGLPLILDTKTTGIGDPPQTEGQDAHADSKAAATEPPWPFKNPIVGGRSKVKTRPQSDPALSDSKNNSDPALGSFMNTGP